MNPWSEIKGCPGYHVSDDGRVRSVKCWHNPKILKPEKTRLGYLRVGLQVNGKKRKVLVHRLVAEAFLKKPNVAVEVNHKDGNKQNNAVANLEWTTRSGNLSHAYRAGLINAPKGERHSRAKLSEEDVRYIRHSSEKQQELADRYGVTQVLVSRIRLRKCWKHVA